MQRFKIKKNNFNNKFEIRISKLETNHKFEIQNSLNISDFDI